MAKETMNETLGKMGRCDKRGLALCATAKRLPNGARGMVALSLKGNDLIISDMDMHNRIQEIVYQIPLKKVLDLKINRSFLKMIFDVPVLTFTYLGKTYTFVNIMPFGNGRTFLDAIEEESKRV